MARIYDVAQQAGAYVEDGGRHVLGSARRASNGRWMERLARAGLVAKGVLYVVIGGLAVWAAFAPGTGGEVTGTQGAIHTIAAQPFGIVLLALLALGLVGYALMRLAQAIFDLDGEGRGKKGIAKRIGYAVSGLIHAALAVWAVGLIFSSGGGGGGGDAANTWTARLMSAPFGVWLVGIVGGILIAVGLFQLWDYAYKAKFRQRLKLGEMTRKQERWTTRLGRFGYGARGVVFGMIGVFLIIAAWQTDPSEARGLDGALQALAATSYGPWLLGIVALGFVAYGVYCFAEARFRRIGRRSAGYHGSPSVSRRRAA